MDRPDFGIGKYYATKWTQERIGYLRHLADRGLSASQIAADIYGDATKGGRISEACKRHSIRLHGRSGRRPHISRPILVEIPEAAFPALDRLGQKYKMAKSDVGRRLIAAMFEQGEAFLENMLDLGDAG